MLAAQSHSPPAFADPREQLDAFNRTAAPFPADRCLHQLVEAQARRAPDAPAVLFRDETVTYAQLDARANRLARHLRGLGVGPEVPVAICLERGPELLAAMLGVLKAGGAYVPLDPAYPSDRLARMMADARTAVAVTEEALRERVPPRAGTAVVSVDRDAPAIAAHDGGPVESTAGPRNLAYVVYTSGSTGIPKGIGVEHRGVVNNLVDWTGRFGIGAADRSLLVSSMSFDVSVFESLGMLAVGAAVVVPAPAELRDPPRWAALMRRHGVTVWNSATALLGMLADHVERHPHEAPLTLRLAFAGGDTVPLPLPARLRARIPGVQVVVMGGVTEVSIYSILFPVGEIDPGWHSLPYGAPMANQRAYVLDEALLPLPVGEAGEQYIGGASVTRGYVGRPGFTAERFLPDPYAAEPGARMYRTGDGSRWRADGTLEFLGRLDAQVKIRGNRVEPGEIEAVLRLQPGVERCVVAARDDHRGEKRLVAYVVGAADLAALRRHVRQTLPEYMVPAAFVTMDVLPLSPNGKVDRRALPAPDFRDAAREYTAPRTQVEQVLARAWCEVLPAERVGVHDHFFDLGGDSVRVMRLVAHVRDTFGVDLTFRAVLDVPTLEAMAAEVERMLYDEILNLSDAQAEQLLEMNPIAGGTR